MNVTLDLTPDDAELLMTVIRSYLDDLHDEIAHTESYDFREALQARQQRLNDLLGRLGQSS